MHRTSRTELRWNGWGRTDHTFDLKGHDQEFWQMVCEATGGGVLPDTPGPSLEEMPVEPSALTDDDIDALRAIVGAEHVHVDRYERLFHAAGKSYLDLLRIRARALRGAPDAVVYPATAEHIAALLAWASKNDVVVIPFGGGSSVVGGVEARRPEGRKAVLTIDMTRMNAVLSLDPVSLLATVQAGLYGPELEEALQSRGFTLGHFPQSFEFSTLGGWIAARGAGQQSNRYGTADKFLSSARVVAPTGVLRTVDFPQSAAGPNLNQLIAGSEGTLGIIADATVKVHPVPAERDLRTWLFPSFAAGADAVRGIVQGEVPVAMMRLSDAEETKFYSKFGSLGKSISGVKKLAKGVFKFSPWGKEPCLLLVGFEGDAQHIEFSRDAVGRIARKNGGLPLGKGPGQSWWKGRFEMPYLRDPLMDRGVGVDTLETSTWWSNINDLHKRVRDALRTSLRETGTEAIIMAHISHSYASGASLYFTFIFRRDLTEPEAQWWKVKCRASDTILSYGGTISHHHGVGADHLPWMESDKGTLGVVTLTAAQKALDPTGIMNPGKLLPVVGEGR
jgi:alkyldihydroxyacetonephosphate synthase